MRFQRDDLKLAYTLRSYSEAGLLINQTYYQKSLIVGKSVLIENWPVASLAQLQAEALQAILDLQPELVLLGTGQTHAFLSAEQGAWFKQHHLAVEAMSTAAAARTFNALVAEGRNVVAALILP